MQPTECARLAGRLAALAAAAAAALVLASALAQLCPVAQAAHGRHASATPSRAPRACSPGSSATAPTWRAAGVRRGS